MSFSPQGDAGNVSIEEAVRHLSENVVLMKAILERLELSIVHTTPEPPTDKVIAGVSFTALGKACYTSGNLVMFRHTWQRI